MAEEWTDKEVIFNYLDNYPEFGVPGMESSYSLCKRFPAMPPSMVRIYKNAWIQDQMRPKHMREKRRKGPIPGMSNIGKEQAHETSKEGYTTQELKTNNQSPQYEQVVGKPSQKEPTYSHRQSSTEYTQKSRKESEKVQNNTTTPSYNRKSEESVSRVLSIPSQASEISDILQEKQDQVSKKAEQARDVNVEEANLLHNVNAILSDSNNLLREIAAIHQDINAMIPHRIEKQKDLESAIESDTFAVPKDVYEKFESVASKRKINIQQALKEAITEYVTRYY